jgi:hypothetical protein
MAAEEGERSPAVISGAERTFEVQLGSLGGFELRPTRLFLWKGDEREASERVVSFGREPVGLDYPRRESTVRLGELEVRTLGNPLMTIVLAGVLAFRRWTEAPDEPRVRG